MKKIAKKPVRRLLGGEVNRQIQHIVAPLGGLGVLDTSDSSNQLKVPGQDAAHRKLGTSAATGSKAPQGKLKGKKGKFPPGLKKGSRSSSSRVKGPKQEGLLPQKRGRPFAHSDSLVHFVLR